MMAPTVGKTGLFSFGVTLLFEIYQISLANVDAQAIVTNDALSSPSSITAMKNSAVWLHWNYTFNDGDGLITFVKQQWTANDTSQNRENIIAENTGFNGQITISSSLPSSLAGRVNVFSTNNTLMIKNLHYNDSVFQFKSTALIKITGTSTLTPKPVSPVVTVTVEGAPVDISSSSTNIEVSENSLLSVTRRFDGNPKPTAEVQWSDSNKKTAMTVNEEYPFIYKAEYSVNQIASSFCGKTLTVRAENRVGKSADINIAVTVILSLNNPNPNLRAGKPNQSCVEVQWLKKESGLCNVTYTVNFKDQIGSVQYTNTEINKSGTTRCGIPANVNITNVELQMSSTKKNAKFTADVSEKPIPPPTSAPTTKAPQPPTTPGTQVGAIVGGAVGGLVALVLLVLLVVYCMKRGKRDRDRDNDSGEPGYPLANKKENVYASADEPHKTAPEPTYADPNKPTLIYGKLGEGGGRKGPRPPRNEPSEYADVMLDENGYPAVGAVTSYTDGYGDKPRSREGSGRRGGSENRRPPPPYTEPKLDEDGYPTGGRVPPVYAQVDKSRRKR